MNLDCSEDGTAPGSPDALVALAPPWLELLDQLPDGVMRVDPEGHLRYANAAAIRMLRLDAEDLAGGLFGHPLLDGEIQEISIHPRQGERQMAELHSVSIAWGEGWSWLVSVRPSRAHEPLRDQLDRSNTLLHAIVHAAPMAIVALDRDLRVSFWNRAASEMLGWQDYELLGRPPPCLAEDPQQSLAGLAQAALESQSVRGRELNDLARRDGRRIDAQVWSAILPDRHGLANGVMLMLHDISERRRSQAHQRQQSGRDPLTALLDRAHFRKALRRVLAARRRDRSAVPLVLLKLDIDRFKNVNRSLGQAGGDHLLQQVAQRLAGHLYESDLLGRTGSDEFGILLNDTRQMQDGARVAERLQGLFGEPFPHGDEVYYLSASIGIAVHPRDGGKADALLDAADHALAQAKKTGGGGIAHYSDVYDHQARNLLALEGKLRQAAGNDELFLLYQPQFGLDDGRLHGVEALLRWRHPVLGTVPPGEFIPLAETSGAIHAMGSWALRQACRQLHAWQGRGWSPRLALNLSPRQFQSRELVGEIAAVIEVCGIDPARLELELTESCLLHDLAETARILTRLKSLGVRLAIDDFGTGYSSLAYLAELPFDTLKIDQAFVRKLAGDPRIGAIIEAVGNLGRGLGLNVVAEGIETVAQLEFMRRMHCHEVQGFLLARPMPAEALEEYLAGQPCMAYRSS